MSRALLRSLVKLEKKWPEELDKPNKDLKSYIKKTIETHYLQVKF